MEKPIVSDEKEKPVFDEQTLAKLLEAAYVLQEHSHELRALETEFGLVSEKNLDGVPAPPETSEHLFEKAAEAAFPQTEVSGTRKTPQAAQSVDYAAIPGQVAEIQHQIAARHLALDQALALLTEHLIDMCGAAGAAIGISSGNDLCYRAVAGIRTLPLGSCIPFDKAFCFPCLRTGQAFRCPDTNAELLIDAQDCRRRGIGSFIAVPVFEETGVAGGLELYYSDRNAFSDRDVQTCQLVAGVASEAITHQMKAGASLTPPRDAQKQGAIAKAMSPFESVQCYRCGHELVGEEQFCGQCGAARGIAGQSSTMQGKVASLWHKQQASDETLDVSAGNKPGANEPPSTPANKVDTLSLASEVPINLRLQEQLPGKNTEDTDVSGHEIISDQEAKQQKQEDAPAASAGSDIARSADWSSALSAREFLEQVAGRKRRGRLWKFWNEHRGDIYLAVAVVLVICVIRWALWTNHSTNATSAAAPTPAAAEVHKPSAPQLTLFDRMLISLGLAEAPQPPESRGNPSVSVWVDLQTGLYYCPGTDQYGKTPKGKYASQRDAQLDQFAPAYRKACD